MKKDKKLLAFLCGTAVLLSSIHAADAVPETEKPDHECTSWMVFPDLTKNNTLFLHKNRDSSIKTIAVFSGEEKKAEKAEKSEDSAKAEKSAKTQKSKTTAKAAKEEKATKTAAAKKPTTSRSAQRGV